MDIRTAARRLQQEPRGDWVYPWSRRRGQHQSLESGADIAEHHVGDYLGARGSRLAGQWSGH